MDTAILKEIGLTNAETHVYLALIRLGEAARGDIVHTSNVAGSKVYDLLHKLQEKGLVSVYLKNKIQHFKPTNPSQLITYIEEKKEKLKKIEQQTRTLLPSLLAQFNSFKKKQEVELITGLKGLEVIFREQVSLLDKGETCFVIGGTWGTGQIDETIVQTFFEKIHLLREEKGIKTKMLFNINQKAVTEKLYSSKKYPETKTHYIEHTSPVAINIYKDRTVIIIFSSEINAIHIKSKDVAESFKEYFNLLWNTK
ncbi:MAG TPA: helix-turn-helix domain-containing protein [Candidatus Nanoarchaeia archaeon]|nr:helix-turn-helix domain-containing protein [Candidatus Nanoarchaeia archaeon]